MPAKSKLKVTPSSGNVFRDLGFAEEEANRLLHSYVGSEHILDEAMAILERTGAQDYTRAEARRWRDEAIAQLDAAGVVQPEARAKLEQIMRSVISA